ncbi:histidine phosphatase family protein [Motiliproteus sp. SC1-56]|uniref:histidine phosphatase family protein n=1 Tax=Motiliproteus sp. SC1-56 TaxID=2799565 RepID=UPI001A901A1B
MSNDLDLLLLRHAATEWNREKRLQGRRDIPLSPQGRESLAGRAIPEPFNTWRWFTSPLQRARQTAALLGIEAPRLAPALGEMDWGEWEGERLPELRQRLGAAMARAEARGLDLQPPGGESPRAVQARVLAWLEKQSGQLGAVTHKGVIRALLSVALQWDMRRDCPVKPDWQQGIWLQRRGGNWRLRDYNIPLVGEERS